MSFASVTVIMACLIIMGSVSLLSVNIDALIKDLEDQNEVVAFVDDSITDEDEAKALQSSVEAVDNVSSVEFVSRTDAMDAFMSKYDDSLMEGIDETVFRHRYVIHLTDISQMAETERDLRNVPGIAKFGRREEIAIMKMVGANNSFIRMPFVVEGLVLGILGGGLAFFAEWGIYELITGELVSSLTGSFISVVPFRSVAMIVLIVYLGTGILVGAVGGVNAIRNYLKV